MLLKKLDSYWRRDILSLLRSCSIFHSCSFFGGDAEMIGWHFSRIDYLLTPCWTFCCTLQIVCPMFALLPTGMLRCLTDHSMSLHLYWLPLVIWNIFLVGCEHIFLGDPISNCFSSWLDWKKWRCVGVASVNLFLFPFNQSSIDFAECSIKSPFSACDTLSLLGLLSCVRNEHDAKEGVGHGW